MSSIFVMRDLKTGELFWLFEKEKGRVVILGGESGERWH
jgi:hypothetical protein